jgi:hypothetical protein
MNLYVWLKENKKSYEHGVNAYEMNENKSSIFIMIIIRCKVFIIKCVIKFHISTYGLF